MKGGEGLEQPFTPIFLWPSATYTEKVKGEGFLAIFFGVHRLLIIKKQCKITKFPPHIQTFPHVFSFKSRDKQRMILYLSNRGTNIQGHRVRYLGSLFRVDVPVLLISLIIIPEIWVQAVSGIYCDYTLACWICVQHLKNINLNLFYHISFLFYKKYAKFAASTICWRSQWAEAGRDTYT